MTDDRQRDVAFEPTRIGRRRRGPDPFVVGVVIVVGGLLLAVVKPWAGPIATVGATSSPKVSATASPSPTAVPFGTILLDDPLATVTVLDALEPHDEWGVGAVERAPDFRTGYRERWIAAPPASDGRAVAVPAGEPTLAIGITTPANETPLDVRVFRDDGTDEWSWLDVHRVTTDRPAGSLLLRPPRVFGSDQAAWPAGTYRIELLMGTSIETIDLTLPYPTSRVPPPFRPSPDPRKTDEVLIGSVTEPGAVLLDDGFIVPLAVAPGGPFDAVGAWLAERRSIEDGSPLVASVPDPYARTLGVMLPADADRVEATLSRIAPAGPLETPRVEVVTDQDRGILPHVAFETSDGQSWAPGTYAMRVRWRDGAGQNDATWHVSLLPGEPDPEPAILRAARAFEGVAGRDGIVVGPSFGQEAGPGRYVASYLAFDRTEDRSDVEPIACGETFIGGKPEVVGVSHPVEVWTAAVTMALLVPGGETRSVPLRTAELRGLTLIEPARGASFAQGVYRLAIADEAGHMTVAMVCLGTSPFEG